MRYPKRGQVYNREWIKELWGLGFPAEFIAREVGCSKKLVWVVTRGLRPPSHFRRVAVSERNQGR